MTDAPMDDYEADPFAEDVEEVVKPQMGIERLISFAQAQGDVSSILTASELAQLGADVIREWVLDDDSRADWKDKAQLALDKAAQEKTEAKSYPWDKASNVNYPILTVAALQFGARAYPGIVRGDEAVSCKVFGRDPDGKKAARAERVKTFLNYKLFYQIEDWEADTDALIHQLPIIGCAFRKVWYDAREGRKRIEYVTAMRVTVNQNTKSLDRAPRITHDYDLYPYEIKALQESGDYREFTIVAEGEDEQASRLILEQHRLHDLDGDGVVEPYIVTVDKQSGEVLAVVPDYGMDDVDIVMDDEDQPSVWRIKRRRRFIKYGFLPDPKGRFYDIGFGHLLAPVTAVIDSTINMMLDAGHAQVAGGGFIASGLRLQGAGQRTSAIRFSPGEYITVPVTGQDLRAGIVERTFPAPSPVLYQLLDMMLGAAKDIAAIKDVLSGEASSATMPVGTVLALIDQGLQVFTSIYKRIYRSLKDEYQLLFECERDYPEEELYLDVVDDENANFAADFEGDGHDIRPIADPSAITKMQSLARGQFLMQMAGDPTLDRKAVLKRVLEAAEIPDVDALFAKEQGPPPGMAEQMAESKAKTEKTTAEAEQTRLETSVLSMQTGIPVEPMNDAGPMGSMAGAPGDEGGVPGDPAGLGGPADGMDASLMGGQPVGPAPAYGIADAG